MSMKTHVVARLSIIALLVTTLLSACSRSSENVTPATEPPEKISICQGGVLGVLTLIAQNRGYFSEAGLNATVVTKGDGKLALDALLAGDCTFSTCGEPPLVSNSFIRDDYAILATLGNNQNATKLIVRKDLGVSSPRDLKGKVIGVRRGTLSHFFLDQFLKKHAIRPREVTLRFMEPGTFADALARGEIVGYSGTDEQIIPARQKMADTTLVFSEAGLSSTSVNLVVRKKFAGSNPKTVNKLLQALLKAEKYAAQHPAEAREIIRTGKGLSAEELEIIFKDQTLDVTLPKTLLLNLEDHSRWVIEQRMTTTTSEPNMLNIIDFAPLKALKPSAVSISR